MGSWARQPCQPSGTGRHGAATRMPCNSPAAATATAASSSGCGACTLRSSPAVNFRLGAASAAAAGQGRRPGGGGCRLPSQHVTLPRRRGFPKTRASAAAATSCAQVLCPDGWPLWTLLLTCAAVGQLADARTRLGGLLGGPLVSMLCAVLLAAAGVIPVDTALYDVVWQYLMPTAAACFLLDTDMAMLISTGGTVLLSFLIGALGMVLGAVVGCQVLTHQLGAQGSCVAAALCSSYVGGSINFVAISQAVGLSAEHVPVAMAADNIAMAAYLAILSAVPVHAIGATGSSSGSDPSSGVSLASAAHSPPGQGQPAAGPAPSHVTAGTISLSLACAAASCTLSQPLAAALNLRPLALTIMAVVAISLASALRLLLRDRTNPRSATGTSTPHQEAPSPFAGSTQIGGALMLVFFAVIGASAGGLVQPGAGAGGGAGALLCMVVFLSVMVAVHWTVLAAAGRLLGLPTQALLLGSNACIGGPATAASMAMSKGWTSMTQTAMLVGSLGYAIGTSAGLAVYALTRMQLGR